MENKYINRYRSFCRSLKNLEKSRKADPTADFVLEGTVLNFSLTFDISWKVMKDILVKELGVLDFAMGSPRETLQQAFANGMIDSDLWMQMLRVRNQLAHDYDGTFAADFTASDALPMATPQPTYFSIPRSFSASLNAIISSFVTPSLPNVHVLTACDDRHNGEVLKMAKRCPGFFWPFLFPLKPGYLLFLIGFLSAF